jgi:hypothetical protein
MKSINEVIGQELQWVHPKVLRGEYELLEGDELYARYHSQSGSGSQVRVDTANGNWLIKRKGFSQAITVLAFDSQTELATINRSMSGKATLQTLDGHEYSWHCQSFWRDVWTWFNNENTPLLHMRRGSHIQLEPAAHNRPDLALLASLGLYLHKQQEEEATVASIVPIIV